MKRRIIPFYYYLAIISFVIMNSCATTSLPSVWMDDKYQGGALKNILVIGVIEPQTLRKYFEDELVRQLKINGIKGVPSYSVLPDEKMPEQTKIELKIKELGMDSVLVARLVDVLDADTYLTYPSYISSGDFHGYYSLCCQNIVSAGYNVKFETKVFEAKNNKLIWSALSETNLGRSPENMTRSFITAIMKDLYNKKLIQ
jgi:hypothetical protein